MSENGFTILIIEDQQDMMDLLSTLLRRQGYQIQSACTGTEGLVASLDPSIALVLLDVMLPDMNGFDVCLKIKESRPLLPIVILTVRNKPIDVVTGLDSGADDYITKPFTNAVLLARVRAKLRTGAFKTHSQITEQTSSQISKIMLTIAQSLGDLLQPEAIAETIVEHMRAELDVEHGAVCIWRETIGKVVRERVSASDPKVEIILHALGPAWDQVLYNTLRTHEEPIVADATHSAPPVLHPLHKELDARATLAAPIMGQNKLLGALILIRKSPSTFNADELNIITGVTCQAGIALNHARLWSELERNQRTDFEQLTEASELLGIISHELRTPVAAIKGFITTLLSNHRYWDESECEAFLENVNMSIDQLSRLVENVLEMGRLDKGLRLYKRPTRLVSLVQRVLNDLSFQSDRCQFVNEIPQQLPKTTIDPLKIERVLRNLLENSIKFSPQGGTIRLVAKLSEKEIVLGVRDQGIGISPEHLPHIFERFYQAGQTKAHQEGIGLGLYITKELILAHGGRIWAESQVGRGATFFFTLPLNGSPPMLERALGEGVHPSPRPESLSDWSHQHEPGTKVLIVEDDSFTEQSLEKSLQAEGFEIVTTGSGKEAIELAQTENPDLILLDLGLPDVDGFVVCERVRQFSSVPIIVITGRKTEHDKVRGLGLGADDFLTKPLSHPELLARVRAVLRRIQVSEETNPPTHLRFNGVEIDAVRPEVKTPRGSIKLTRTEHKLLYYLASNAGRVLTHQQLLNKVWGYECDNQTQYLWVNISRLRKKIEPDPSQPSYIMTEPGIGYFFSELTGKSSQSTRPPTPE